MRPSEIRGTKQNSNEESNMIILGLTGSIGTGKSTVSRYLQKRGIPVLDADQMVKDLYADKKFCRELSVHFGENILNEQGYIDTLLFGRLVFENKEWLQQLNRMIHPRIKVEFEKRKALLSNGHPIVVYDIPLLYEANMEELVDVVALVCLDKQKQIARIRERDNRTLEQIEQIIGYQMPQEEKKERADYVLNNNGTKEALYQQIDDMISDVMSRYE